MLHLVVDVNDSIQIGDQILIVFKKKVGRKSYVSIDAPNDMTIKYRKGTKGEDRNREDIGPYARPVQCEKA